MGTRRSRAPHRSRRRTDLEMRPEADAFDADLMEEVRQAALTEMAASPCAIHLVRIVPRRD